MKKLFSLVLVLSFICITANTSNSQEYWAKIYSPGGAHSIQQTTDGGYIVAGITYSFGTAGGDFWVLKLDNNGNVSWQKTYGGSSTDEDALIQQTSDGGYIMTGSTRSFGAGDNDIWVLKLDQNGNISWSNTPMEEIVVVILLQKFNRPQTGVISLPVTQRPLVLEEEMLGYLNLMAMGMFPGRGHTVGMIMIMLGPFSRPQMVGISLLVRLNPLVLEEQMFGC